MLGFRDAIVQDKHVLLLSPGEEERNPRSCVVLSMDQA